MRIVNTTSVFPECSDLFEVLERLAKAGYEGIDLAFDYCVQNKDFPFMTDGYEDWAYRLRDRAEELGVSFTHGHAAFDASIRGEPVDRTFRCAEILGIKYIVVHPCCHIDGRLLTDKEEYLCHNIKRIKPLLRTAERYNVTLLTENLPSGASVYAENISEFVERVDHPLFGWCYDVGHSHSEGDTLEAFRRITRAPLSLHIHDNDGTYDEHLMPGDGNLDWQDLLHSLKAVGYKGDFVLEANEQCNEADDGCRDFILRELYERSKRMVEYYKGI